MSENEPDGVAAKRRVTLILTWGGVVLVVLLLAGLPYAWWEGKKLAVRSQLDAIVARGEPVNAEQLNAFYAKPPADEDCTELWLEAIRLVARHRLPPSMETRWPGPDSSVSNVPYPGAPWPELEVAEEYLARQAPTLRLAHEAAAKGGKARYPIDFAQGVDLYLPHVRPLWPMTHTLMLEARAHAHRGEAAGAIRSIETGLALVDSVEQEPTTLSQIIRGQCHRHFVTELRNHLGRVPYSDAQLATLQTKLHERFSARRALVGSRAVSIIGLARSQYPGSGASSSRWMLHAPASREHYLASAQALIAVSDKSFAVAKAEFMRLEAESVASPWGRLWGEMTGATPLRLLEECHGAIAQSRLTRIALGLERYFLRTGAFPATLGELVPGELPAIPLDPFTGQGFTYRPSSTGYELFSTTTAFEGEIDPMTGALRNLVVRRSTLPQPALKPEPASAQPQPSAAYGEAPAR
jgi:hypothetical protein